MKKNKLITQGKKLLFLFLFLFIFATFVGCSNNEIAHTIILEDAFSITPYLTFYSSNRFYNEYGEKIEHEVNDLLQRLDQKFDCDNEESMIYDVNKNAGKKDVEVDTEFALILSTAFQTSKNVSSKYDVTIYPLTLTWGFKEKYFKGNNYFNAPEFQAIEEAKDLVDYTQISLKNETRDNQTHYYVQFEKKGAKIDLGSIVKGYATDKVYEILKQYNVKNGFINIGGNVYTFGQRSFNVGITTPYHEDYDDDCGIIGYVKTEQKNYTFVTTGVYERFIQTSTGIKYHHILDKETGYPIENDLLAVTIIKTSEAESSSEISIDADALSTAVFTLGLEKGLDYVNNHEMEAIFITKNNVIICSNGIKDQFTVNQKLIENGYAIQGGK